VEQPQYFSHETPALIQRQRRTSHGPK